MSLASEFRRIFDWKYNDWGVNAMSEEAVRQRLAKEGYMRWPPTVMYGPKSRPPRQVWTSEHIVTIDASVHRTAPNTNRDDDAAECYGACVKPKD